MIQFTNVLSIPIRPASAVFRLGKFDFNLKQLIIGEDPHRLIQNLGTGVISECAVSTCGQA